MFGTIDITTYFSLQRAQPSFTHFLKAISCITYIHTFEHHIQKIDFHKHWKIHSNLINKNTQHSFRKMNKSQTTFSSKYYPEDI